MDALTLFRHERLEDVARRLLQAGGAPEDIARRVAFSLVDSNLKGVDSHGVARLPNYLQQVEDGDIDPAGRPAIVLDRDSSVLVRGNRGFGIHAMEEAAAIAVDRARKHHVCSVGVIDAGHAGRIGLFAAQIAREGLFALILGGGDHERGASVVPHGGARPIMRTNPYALAVPGTAPDEPVVIDFATSAVARGKVAVYAARDEPVPEGWIVDAEGRPTTDPHALFNGGMQLPAAGHKGYGMALVAQLLCFAMLKSPPRTPGALNWMIFALDIGVFRDLAAFRSDAAEFLATVKTVPPAAGHDRVLVPGEPERLTEAVRREEGVPLPAKTWQAIRETAEKWGLEPDSL